MKTETIPSQEKVILDMLQAQPGVPIPMPKLAAASESMNVHTRVAALNKGYGKIIWNLCVRHGRRWHSYYFYRALNDPNKEPEFIPA